jgi:peptidyl-prolyl cis-trans isomerase D
MFDFIRTHQRLMQFILLLLIVPSFVFFGIQGYERMNQRTQEVAKVGGQAITQAELDDAQRQQLDRLRQQLGSSLDPSLFDTPEARAQTLQGLISQRVLMQQATRQSLGVTDAQLQQTIMGIPGLQEGGRFNADRYQSILAQQGMTPTMFEARLRQDLAIQALGNVVQQSSFAPKSVVDRLVALSTQRRTVAQSVVKVADYTSRVQLPEDAIQKDYDAHPNDFTVPESLKVEYVTLSADALAKQMKVPEEDIRKAYEGNAARYTVAEQRRASHILIAAPKDASDADKAKAKAKADDVLAKLRANPGDFAKLAKQYSDDPGSAANGGDLDYMARGATVPPFEAALFSQKKDEIGNVVQSDFGFHIIKVTDIRGGGVKPLEAVRGEIEQELGKQLAQKKYSEAAEGFANSVYEQGDSLAPTAKTFGLTVTTADNVTRVPGPTLDAASPLGNAKLLAALFTPDSLKTHHNTEAIEVSPGTLVSARVLDVRPASKKPLSDVAAAIKARLTDAEAKKLADAAGKAKLAELQGGNDKAATFGAASAVPRLERSDLPADAVEAVFRVDRAKLPGYVGLTAPNGDYTIYRVSAIETIADADPTRRNGLKQSLERAAGTLEFAGYLDDLRRRSKVKVYPPYAELIDNKAPAKAGS